MIVAAGRGLELILITRRHGKSLELIKSYGQALKAFLHWKKMLQFFVHQHMVLYFVKPCVSACCTGCYSLLVFQLPVPE